MHKVLIINFSNIFVYIVLVKLLSIQYPDRGHRSVLFYRTYNMPPLARSMTAGQFKNTFGVRIKNNTHFLIMFHFEKILLE